MNLNHVERAVEMASKVEQIMPLLREAAACHIRESELIDRLAEIIAGPEAEESERCRIQGLLDAWFYEMSFLQDMEVLNDDVDQITDGTAIGLLEDLGCAGAR